jgi:hypothetical protein
MESSIGNSDSTTMVNQENGQAPKRFMTLKQIQTQVSQFIEKRFGKNNPRMSVSYQEMVSKMLKGNDLKCSLDFMTKLETSNFNYILYDFTSISQIFIYTDKCGPKELQRHEENQRRSG